MPGFGPYCAFYYGDCPNEECGAEICHEEPPYDLNTTFECGECGEEYELIFKTDEGYVCIGVENDEGKFAGAV